MQACSYTHVIVLSGFLALAQFAGCATKGTPPASASTSSTEPASAEGSSEDIAPSYTSSGDGAPANDGAKAQGIAIGEPNPSAPSETTKAKGSTASGASDGPETRSLEVIQKIVSDNRKPVRACYEKARKQLPDLKGTLTIHFVLDPEGKVKSAELNLDRSDIKSPEVVDCAIATIKGLSFPASSKGMETTVNYPYSFKP